MQNMEQNHFETEKWAEKDLASISSLAQDCVHLLRGCDDLVLRKTLQDVYADFCLRTEALRTHWHFPFLHGPHPVPLPLPGCVASVTHVYRQRHRLRPGRDWWLEEGMPPCIYLREAPHDKPPPPPPHEGDGVLLPPRFAFEVEKERRFPWHHRHREMECHAEATYVPTVGCEEAPAWFLARWGRAIVSGTLARMFEMNNHAWADKAQAQRHLFLYMDFCNQAKARTLSPLGSQQGRASMEDCWNREGIL